MASRTSKRFMSMFTFLLCVAGIGVFFGEPDSKMFSRDTFQQQDESPCACRSCLSRNDTWFVKHFDMFVEPFLSQQTNLSRTAFYWWKRLQGERRSFITFRETMNMVFRVFPLNPDVVDPWSQDCRTCAVVGNSINLNGSGYGPLIDSHDVIIRINRGKTKGYEADVGNRTTHRIMYPESSGVDLEDDTHLVLFPFKIKDIEWLLRVFTVRFPGKKLVRLVELPFKDVATGDFGNESRPFVAQFQKKTSKYGERNRELVSVLNPAFMKYVHNSWLDKQGRYPSTGFMTLILALHLCTEVDVFGYGADKDGNWSHYWEKLRNKAYKTGIHPGTYEYDTIQKLASKHKISFFPGR